MNEDHDRTRVDNAPHNLAVLRHMALNVMQKDVAKGFLRTKFMRTTLWISGHAAVLRRSTHTVADRRLDGRSGSG